MSREMQINCLSYNRGSMRHRDHLTAKEDDAQIILNIIEGNDWANIYLTPETARQLAIWLICSAGNIENRHPELLKISTNKEQS